MHKKKKPYVLPLKNPAKGIGYGWDVKLFPNSMPGNSGGAAGFPKPGQNPPTNIIVNPQSPPQDFQAWVNYYAGVIGYYVCVLNGLQFNLDEEKAAGPPNGILRMMSDVLDEFATRLHIGHQYSADYALNPKQLVWPLTGPYYFRYHFPAVNPNPQFWVDLDLFFECDPDTLICTNCLVKVRFTDALTKLDPVSAEFVAAVDAGGEVPPEGIQNPDFISSSSSYLATSSSSYP
jgi:hypothetical protein